MKTKGTLLFILLLVLATVQYAHSAKWRVSNVTGINANFTSLQQANDNASVLPGDTIYLEGSAISYGNPVITKKLIIIGPGYFLSENDSTQANKVPATASNLSMNSGSEGSMLTGICISSALSLNAGNIVVKHCNSAGVTSINSANNILSQSFFTRLWQYYPASNNLIENNLIWAPAYEYCISMATDTYATIYNNVISGNTQLCNADFRSNILTGNSSTNYAFTVTGGCTIKNNISASVQLSGYPENMTNVDMSTVFVCWANCTGFSTDGRYMLLPASPAIGYGYNGVDCGMYGGNDPYVLSGIPDFPAVWELEVSGTNVTVKAKSH